MAWWGWNQEGKKGNSFQFEGFSSAIPVSEYSGSIKMTRVKWIF